MQYLPELSMVVYRAKEGSEEKVFDALEWLAAMCSYIPGRWNRWISTKDSPIYQSQHFKW
jgi:hypothetical protein